MDKCKCGPTSAAFMCRGVLQRHVGDLQCSDCRQLQNKEECRHYAFVPVVYCEEYCCEWYSSAQSDPMQKANAASAWCHSLSCARAWYLIQAWGSGDTCSNLLLPETLAYGIVSSGVDSPVSFRVHQVLLQRHAIYYSKTSLYRSPTT